MCRCDYIDKALKCIDRDRVGCQPVVGLMFSGEDASDTAILGEKLIPP